MHADVLQDEARMNMCLINYNIDNYDYEMGALVPGGPLSSYNNNSLDNLLACTLELPKYH
jgi:hypothetical protein